MRILHVNKFLYRRGGAESYMLDVAALQTRRGHDVALFGMEHPENPPLPYEHAFPRHVELEPMPGGLAAKLRGFGRILWSTQSRQGIEEVLWWFRPHVVHLHNIYHQLSPSILRPLAREGVPAVMTLHDYKLACPTYQFLDQTEICEACVSGGRRQAVRRRCRSGSLLASGAMALESALHARFGAYDPVLRFVCPSRFLAGKMAEAGVYPERMRVVRHFFDTEGIQPRSGPGSGVAFVGRLSPEKGVDVLIRALALLPDDVRLEVAGDGPSGPALRALADDLAPGQVRFHGRLDRAGVLALLRGSTVAAVPSQWYENQPMTVLEAFACGVPVVASDLGGLAELVTPGETGDLVPAGDPAALAEALKRILADQEAAQRMGRAARAAVTDGFAPDDHCAALDTVYTEAAEAAAQEGRR